MKETIKDLIIAFAVPIILHFGLFQKDSKFHITKIFSFVKNIKEEKFFRILGRIQQANMWLAAICSWMIYNFADIHQLILLICFASVFGKIMYRAAIAGFANIPQSKHHPAINTIKYIIGLK